MSGIAAAVEVGNLDELTRLVDRVVDARDWDGLVELRDRCVAALDRGKQLWPIASHAEYRLALEAPAEHAAIVLVEGTGHLGPGPLAEVAASTHTWAELRGHLRSGPIAALVAHERVVRGERIDEDVAYHDVFDVPLALQPWEPNYEVAKYRPEGGEFPSPIPARGSLVEVDASAPMLPPDDAVRALAHVFSGWTTTSDATVQVAAIGGGIDHAIGARVAGQAYRAWLAPAEAMGWLGWAGACGGRKGRRRGAAAGRDVAWAAAAALVGFDPDEAVEPAALGAALEDLRFAWWSPDGVDIGWAVRLAVQDPHDGLSWVVEAIDPEGSGHEAP